MKNLDYFKSILLGQTKPHSLLMFSSDGDEINKCRSFAIKKMIKKFSRGEVESCFLELLANNGVDSNVKDHILHSLHQVASEVAIETLRALLKSSIHDIKIAAVYSIAKCLLSNNIENRFKPLILGELYSVVRDEKRYCLEYLYVLQSVEIYDATLVKEFAQLIRPIDEEEESYILLKEYI